MAKKKLTCKTCEPDLLCEKCYQEHIESEIDNIEYQMEDR